MKRKPKAFKITICGYDWHVSFVDNLAVQDIGLICGITDSDAWQILLRSDMTTQLLQVTIWHEITHAVLSAVMIWAMAVRASLSTIAPPVGAGIVDAVFQPERYSMV